MKSEKEQLVDFVFFMFEENGMEKLLQRESKDDWLSSPIKGVRQAANDMVEMTQDIKDKELEIIDIKLNYLGLPTLTILRQEEYKRLIKILSKGKLKNEDEWRVLRSFTENDDIDESQKIYIQKLLDEYEFSIT